MRAGCRTRKGDRRAGGRAAHVFAAGAAHRQEAAQRHRGLDAFDRDRTRRPLLQPAAQVGRFCRRRRGVPRQASCQIQGKLTMKWCRFSKDGETSFGLIEGETVVKIDGTPWGQNTVTGQIVPLKEVKLELPVIPSTFFCVGVNYRDHVERMAARRGTKPSFPPRPDIGYRANNALIAHDENIVKPRDAGEAFQYEGELVAVFGRRCRNVSKEAALDY